MSKEHTHAARWPDPGSDSAMNSRNDVEQRVSDACPPEAWWIRALDNELSAIEWQIWQQHLAVCDVCRSEWEALMHVEAVLQQAPAPPPLPADFTARTMQRLAWRKRARVGLTWLGSLVMVSFVTLIILSAVGSLLSQANQFCIVLRASWDVLLGSLIQLTTDFLIASQTVLPIALAMAGALLLLMMPNGVLATYALVLIRQSRRRPSLSEG
jgi:predicted anti-sigma-YlaC factor YlaD